MGNKSTRDDIELRDLMIGGMAAFALLLVLNAMYYFRDSWISRLPFETNALQHLRQFFSTLW